MSTAIRRSLPLALSILGIVVLGTLLYLSLSQPPGFNYIGEWMGNRNLKLPDLSETMQYTAGRVTLTIKPNMSEFELTEAGVPTGGRLSNQGDHLELETTTYMNLPLERQGKDASKMHPIMKVRPQKDGTLLLEDPAAIDGKPVVLKRLPPKNSS